MNSQVNTYDSKKYFGSSNEEQLEGGLRGTVCVLVIVNTLRFFKCPNQ